MIMVTNTAPGRTATVTVTTLENPQETWHRGDWMQTHTNVAFYPMDPRAEDINSEDIAHALGNLCRYNGHVSRFYSVAEHCYHLSTVVPREDALWALLHDATEAYLGDMIRPLKRFMPDYVAAEDRVMEAIAEKFGLESSVMPPSVREADSRILLDERAALKGEPPQTWDVPVEPLGVEIFAWEPSKAKIMYLNRLNELTTWE